MARTRSASRLAEHVPFMALGPLVVALATVEDPGFWSDGMFAAGAVLTVAVPPLGLLLLTRLEHPAWLKIAVAASGIVSLAMLAAGSGGAESSYLAMPIVPLMWFVVHGSSRQLAGGCALFAALLVAPVLAGLDGYGGDQWFHLAVVGVLGAMVSGGLRRVIVERDAANGRLAALSRIDPLTGALNRAGWEQAAAGELARAARRGQPTAVAMLDLDWFKAVNDTRGHSVGDELLRQVTTAWNSALREGDILGRVGGDEFAVVLHDCDADVALEAVERLRVATPSEIGFSAGVARVEGRRGLDAALVTADRAMYRAKAAGRGRTMPGVSAQPAAGSSETAAR